MPSYNAFGPYMKRLFGQLVHKINIDAGFTCPNRDGTLGEGGCIYCNNESFKPGACRPEYSVREQVRNGMAYVRKRYGAEKFLAYFQPYTNTYAPVDELRRLYAEALEDPSVVGLAIGTRPDCVDEQKLDMLAEFARDRFVLVEYGLQSVYDRTLRFINRGHGLDEFLRAVELTRARGIHAGAHLIMGFFSTETSEEMLDMAEEVSGTGVDFLKIHQLQVIDGTPLAAMYRDKPFHVFGYREYLDFIVRFLERLSPHMVIQRLFATAPDGILVAPRWDRTRHEVLKDIDGMFAEMGTRQGKRYKTYSTIG
jgi:radical SAM protein (TIGR01212 family)